MITSFDTFQKFAEYCDSYMHSVCLHLLNNQKIHWNFLTGSVSADGTCTAEFDAPASLEGRRYYHKIMVADGNICGTYSILKK